MPSKEYNVEERINNSIVKKQDAHHLTLVIKVNIKLQIMPVVCTYNVM